MVPWSWMAGQSEIKKSENTFTCALCGGTFEKGWTDEEMMDEAEKNFGDIAFEGNTVCDDCYRPMAKRYGWEVDDDRSRMDALGK